MNEQERKELARQRLEARRARNAGLPDDAPRSTSKRSRSTSQDASQGSPKASSALHSVGSGIAALFARLWAFVRKPVMVNVPIIGTVGRPVVIGAVAALIVLLLVVTLAVRGCSAPESSGASSSASAASSEAAEPEEVTGEVDFDGLASFIGDDLAQVLVDQAETDPDVRWIASHVDDYAIEDWDVQQKILKLAATDPFSISYVRHFPEDYPADGQSDDPALALDDGLSGTSFETKVPHLYQWDRRWAYCVYSSTTFGLTGCGPTCMAMVSQALTGSNLTPWDMAVRAYENGYMSQFEGTDSTFFLTEAANEGIACWAIPAHEDYIRAALAEGQVIIANLGPGYFTQYGHFFVIAGLADNGDVIVNDPYSVVRSSQTWDPGFIAGECIGLFTFVG